QEAKAINPGDVVAAASQRRRRHLARYVDDAEWARDLVARLPAGEDAANICAGLSDDTPSVGRADGQRGQRAHTLAFPSDAYRTDLRIVRPRARRDLDRDFSTLSQNKQAQGLVRRLRDNALQILEIANALSVDGANEITLLQACGGSR